MISKRVDVDATRSRHARLIFAELPTDDSIDDALLDCALHRLQRMRVFAVRHGHALARQTLHVQPECPTDASLVPFKSP